MALQEGLPCPNNLSPAHLVDGDSVHVGVIHKPDDLVGEQFSVVLRAEVGLSGLGGVELQPLADAFTQHIQGRVGLHDLRHGLLNQRLGPREPVAVGTETERMVTGGIHF